MYELGTIEPGESARLGPMTKRSELKTLLTGRKVVFSRSAATKYRQEVTPYDQSSTDLPYILRTMMFYEAAGGRRYTGLWNAYQGFVDLSTLLKADRAILVAQGPDCRGDDSPRRRVAPRRPAAGRSARSTCHHVSVCVSRKEGEEWIVVEWSGGSDRPCVTDHCHSTTRPLTTDHSPLHDQDPRPHQSLRRPARHQQPHPRSGRGRPVRLHRPQRLGQDHDHAILATLLQPTWGEASVCGYSIYTHPKEIRRLIGYMPDFFGVYDDMKVIEYLEFFAAAYRIKGPARRKVCDDMLELVDLGYKRDAFVTSLSRGMTQRLGLARVLLHDPKVLLLDEPASGLDPRARIEIRGLLKELGKLGKTIMVSSHILPELADICNKVGIIERGELLVQRERVRRDEAGPPADAVERRRGRRSRAGRPAVGAEHVWWRASRFSDGQIRVTLAENVTDYSDLPTLLIDAGHKLTLFREEEINLETAFMALTKGITA